MIRVGVIGTGFGRRVVAPCFEQAGAEVVGIVSARDNEGTAHLCRSDLDLVCVHSPPFLHLEHVRRAIDSGHAVLCDKPFGLNAGQAATLAGEVADAGVINLMNFEFRHQPARLAMRQWLDAGAVGAPEHFHYSAFSSGSRVPLRPFGWLFDRSLGGGWIGAMGSHMIDAFRWLSGTEITAAGATTWTTIPRRPDRDGVWQECDAEDAFSAWFELSSGARAAIDTSFTAAVGVPPRIVVFGSEGTIENTADSRLMLRRADGSRQEANFDPPAGDPHLVAMTAWATSVCQAVGEGRQIEPTFSEGLACARVMDRLKAEPTRTAAVSADGAPAMLEETAVGKGRDREP